MLGRTHTDVGHRMSLLALAVVMAVLASLLVTPGSFAEESGDGLVIVEATVLDDLGQPLPIAVCVYLDVEVTYIAPEGDTGSIGFSAEPRPQELAPGETQARWEFDLAGFIAPFGTFLEAAIYPAAVPCDQSEGRMTPYTSESRMYPIFTLDEARSVDIELRRRTLITAEPTSSELIPDDGCVQLYQYADGERTASSARSFGGRPFVLEVEEPGQPFQYGIDQCTFPNTQVEWPFPYERSFFDGVASLAEAADVAVDARTTRDLGTMLLRDLGDVPAEPEPGDGSGDAPEETVGGFSDVPVSYTHAEGIVWLVEQDITAGRTDGTFGPNDPVTRAQMATFLDRALDLDDVDDPPGFPDVDPDNVHAAAIDRLVAAGITAGRADGTFGPNDPVTRGQMATFLFRALS